MTTLVGADRQHYECSETCGFRSSTPPSWERCHTCGAQSETFGEFCQCGAQGFSHICPGCDADVVANHPDTVRP